MSTSARPTLTAAMLMLFVPILVDLTLVLAKLDFQGMAKAAMVSSCPIIIIIIIIIIIMMMMMMIIIMIRINNNDNNNDNNYDENHDDDDNDNDNNELESCLFNRE